jgi:hypothetical protein
MLYPLLRDLEESTSDDYKTTEAGIVRKVEGWKY